MPRFAVSYVDFHDNDLTTVIVSAGDWREALILHPDISADYAWHTEPDLEAAKSRAFDADCLIHVEPIPDDVDGRPVG